MLPLCTKSGLLQEILNGILPADGFQSSIFVRKSPGFSTDTVILVDPWWILHTTETPLVYTFRLSSMVGAL